MLNNIETNQEQYFNLILYLEKLIINRNNKNRYL
jgi:hypothetical protein